MDGTRAPFQLSFSDGVVRCDPRNEPSVGEKLKLVQQVKRSAAENMSTRSCGGSMRVGAGGHEVVLDALYERKRDKKSVRVLTVLIYVFSVSLAAIMLSLYYVFFWEPKDTHQRKVSDTVERQGTTPLPTCLMPHTGRSHACLLTIQHKYWCSS